MLRVLNYIELLEKKVPKLNDINTRAEWQKKLHQARDAMVEAHDNYDLTLTLDPNEEFPGIRIYFLLLQLLEDQIDALFDLQEVQLRHVATRLDFT